MKINKHYDKYVVFSLFDKLIHQLHEIEFHLLSFLEWRHGQSILQWY